MAFHARGHHVYGVEDIVTGQRKGVHVSRVNLYTDYSPDITTELQEEFRTLKNQGSFVKEAIRAVASADSEELIAHMKLG